MTAQRPLTLAANNGDLGGGEIMLLACARMARDLGADVRIVGPDADRGLLDLAEQDGFEVTRLAAGRKDYVRQLAQRRRTAQELLWCHGLVPALATTGQRHRIVHIHRYPRGLQVPVARIASAGALAVLTPSRWLAARTPGATVFENWTRDLGGADRTTGSHEWAPGRPTIGFLGRFVQEKGLDVLAHALRVLEGRGRDLDVVLAGAELYGRPAPEVMAALASLRSPVERLGWVEDPVAFLERIDVLCVPSSEPESFGLVAAEALSAGVPVVVTDAGGLPEVVGAAHPWVARAGDPESLATQLAGWMDATPQTRAASVEAGRRRWEENYSPAAARERMAALLHRVGVIT